MMAFPSTDDAKPDPNQLFARARAGDKQAWEELFKTCYPKVIRVVRRKLTNPSMRTLFDSTDFASDVMTSLAANVDRLDFPSVGALISFLEGVAERKVIDEYRKTFSLKRDRTRLRHLGISDRESGSGGFAVSLAADTPTASQFLQADEAHERIVSGQSELARMMIEMRRANHKISEIALKTGQNIRKVQRFFKDLQDTFLQSQDDS